MSSVGPQLPPHLAKRKRDSDDEKNERSPQSPKNTDSDGPEKRRRVLGPAMPPASLAEKPSEPAEDPDGADKRRRVLGPAMPPASLAERPSEPAEDSDESSDDDDFGPALPPAPGSAAEKSMIAKRRAAEEEFTAQEKEKKPQREEWMLLPPTNDDWSSRVDPTKLKNRKFQSGKGSKAPIDKSGGISAIWTETPEQKRQRLQDEVLGKKDSASSTNKKPTTDTREAEAAAKRIKEYNDKNRSTSLYEEHKKATPREKEDDPSKRAFDKEKDMGLGRKIGNAQKKDLLNKAADFGSRFAKGSYL